MGGIRLAKRPKRPKRRRQIPRKGEHCAPSAPSAQASKAHKGLFCPLSCAARPSCLPPGRAWPAGFGALPSAAPFERFSRVAGRCSPFAGGIRQNAYFVRSLAEKLAAYCRKVLRFALKKSAKRLYTVVYSHQPRFSAVLPVRHPRTSAASALTHSRIILRNQQQREPRTLLSVAPVLYARLQVAPPVSRYKRPYSFPFLPFNLFRRTDTIKGVCLCPCGLIRFVCQKNRCRR